MRNINKIQSSISYVLFKLKCARQKVSVLWLFTCNYSLSLISSWSYKFRIVAEYFVCWWTFSHQYLEFANAWDKFKRDTISVVALKNKRVLTLLYIVHWLSLYRGSRWGMNIKTYPVHNFCWPEAVIYKKTPLLIEYIQIHTNSHKMVQQALDARLFSNKNLYCKTFCIHLIAHSLPTN